MSSRKRSRPLPKTPIENSRAADILKIHEDKMDYFHNIQEVKLPDVKDQVRAFKLVLEDRCELTDRMANAVFKDHNLLRNARYKEKQRRKITNGDVDKQTLARLHAEGHLSEEGFTRVQTSAKEHTNYLRRLKGKSGSRLTLDEQFKITEYIRKQEAWIRQVESQQEYIDYVFGSMKIIREYQDEVCRVEKYIEEHNRDLHAQAIRESKKNCITPGKMPEIIFTENRAIVPADNDPDEDNLSEEVTSIVGGGGIMGWVPQSDIFVRLSELQAAYFQLIDEEDPSGYLQLQMATRAKNSHVTYCQTCHVELYVDESRAEQTCPQCGLVQRWNDQSLRTVPFGDPINPPKNKASYERKTYYEKWKKQVSGELNSSITDEDWGVIFKECTERGWEIVSNKMIKKLLKQMNMSDYYDLIPVITHELNNVPLIKFSKEEELALDFMFDEAQILFEECPFEIKQRSNYISYAYHFYQCCRMLGYDKYLNAFSLLVGDDNLKQHDRIWRWMCENKKTEPKWVFIPTF